MEAVRSYVFPEHFPSDGCMPEIEKGLGAICKDRVQDPSGTAKAFADRLPFIKESLHGDVAAVAHIDPAGTGEDEIILCYPAITAMLHYRTAHELYRLGIPILPRLITEAAHSLTGIDIHPAASIGEHFAIDHGTGIVIGETTVIGNGVTLYQGVTLGAKNFTYGPDGRPLNIPRHPILEDGVTVYSGASILGRITIGHDSIIGGNVWLTESVPPRSRILQGKAVRMVEFEDGAGI